MYEKKFRSKEFEKKLKICYIKYAIGESPPIYC